MTGDCSRCAKVCAAVAGDNSAGLSSGETLEDVADKHGDPPTGTEVRHRIGGAGVSTAGCAQIHAFPAESTSSSRDCVGGEHRSDQVARGCGQAEPQNSPGRREYRFQSQGPFDVSVI